MPAFSSKGEIQVKPGFVVHGTSAVTSNEAEMKGQGVIADQWAKFYQNRVLEKIASRANDAVIALYTRYESDETGFYTYALGAEVAQAQQEPADGLEQFVIPSCRYKVFTTRRGPVQEVVMEAWKEIWAWSKHHERAFLTDFEVYDSRAADPRNSQVDIYISVK
ncbi:putative transcriptional regulator YdeE [Paenibacillus phyllosphaerae]|uniref:Putative transcriptional regulator YdeE n=1 Tax=Paenibacillus phyllosphaerae TaxID=274593 RepID=A0A7W5FNN1_9BACL|nr:GyrI-like domain-containing protein [Paenibacillus phyllosphaerae]MBB3111490.1 putative transcriptional regulator YdeE [Paenibacillus phyllosphaerae]